MALNFKVSVHRNSNNLHLKLMGDFDGSSAFELLNALEKNSNGTHRVIIHTNCLKNIHPFGLETFRRNLSELIGDRTRILFTGENAALLALKGNKFVYPNTSQESIPGAC